MTLMACLRLGMLHPMLHRHAAGERGGVAVAWFGIVCDPQSRQVIAVNLSSGYLYGSISPSLAFLPALSILDLSVNLLYGDLSDTLFVPGSPLGYLNLSYNLLEGEFPHTLANVSNLRTLDLSHNQFMGEIPHTLASLSDLRTLDLSWNQFAGEIPHTLANLSDLRTLALSHNHFAGQIPASLGQLKNLKVLMLIETGLSGAIPGEVWQLPSVSQLWISSVLFETLDITLPDSFGFCGTITQLFFQGSSATGSAIPSSLSDCHQLEVLWIFIDGLQGVIPARIWQLPRLQHLAVAQGVYSDGSLSGHLPQSFASCQTLVELQLEMFNATGSSIPSSLGDCHHLEMLTLNLAGLQGDFPPQIWQLLLLQALIVIDLSDSEQFNLHVSLPTNFSSCAFIRELALVGVSLTGQLPSLGQCTSLQILMLGFTNLQGAIPNSWQNLTNLTVLVLESNNLIGGIPTWLSAFSQLDILNLGDNPNFSGTIPGELGDLTRLRQLSLFNTSLYGPIPESLCKCTQLTGLDLHNNNLSGKIPNQIAALSNLAVLDLSKNKLLGPFPKSLENCSYLEKLRVHQNNLTGEIEHFNFSKLHYLETFTAHHNNFIGGLPRSFADSASLVLFDVQRNSLSGSLDSGTAGIKGLQKLRVLVMSYNNMSGEIPSWLWKLPMLQVLDLSNNHFIGTMPTTVNNLIYFKQNQSEEKNQSSLYEEVYVTIKSAFQVLPYISTRVYLDVSMNHLEGEITESFGNLVGLTGLNLSHNRIHGTIPASLGKLISLDELDLSHNNLTGMIPQQLALIGGLSEVNFSYNDLQGPIPTTNNFNTRYESSSFAHNPQLCGAPLPRQCFSGQHANDTHTTNLEAEQPKKSVWRQAVDRITNFASPLALLVGYIIGFLGVVYLRHYV